MPNLGGDLGNLVRIEVGGVDLSSHFGWARGPMVTRSEAGGTLPPVLGALNAQVISKRPDLESLRGHLVRVPRTLNVDIAEGSNRVWVQDPGMDLSGEGPFAFPTVVLSASELRAVRRGSSDGDDACAAGRDAVVESHSERL